MLDDHTTSSEMPILVIGAAGWDMVGKIKSKLIPHTSNPAQIRHSFGGTARNVAENLLRLGTPVTLMTVVGEDDTGDRLIREMIDVGANVEAVLRSSDFPTGSYLAVVNEAGKLEYGLDDMRLLAELSPSYIHNQEHLFEQASMVFIDTNLSKESTRTIMSISRRLKLPVCADPTSQHLAGKLIPYLSRMYMVVPNFREAAFLCDRKSEPTTRREAINAAKCLVSNGVEIAIVTMDGAGVCYATSETSGYVPPVNTDIIDTTGAGDALTAAVLFGLLNEMPIDDAVRLGVAAESLTMAYRGAVFPDLSLERLYDQLH
ncbi:MAG: ribokinase [Anaerolineales bacterium]|nr:ribokinase [Anaerolineae bacterium]PWB55371.1 MAG: ribokinase [Anaerolineales bacterium]